jgi:hypothetical protein
MTFVSADRKLVGFGTSRCLVIPLLASGQRFSLHVVLRADANAPPGSVESIAEETPAGPPGAPQTPPADLPGGKIGVAAAVDEADAIVKVVAKPTARRPPPPLPVTG